VPNCKNFLVTEAERNHVRRREMSSVFFLQGKSPKEIHAILKEILGKHVPSYDTVQNWVAQLNVVIFPPVMCLILDEEKH
jgi:hypothetical protein